MRKLRLGSLFSGIEGFGVAAHSQGIDTVFTSEIEPFPQRVLEHHFPDAAHLGDITKVSTDELPHADIITAGSPCFVAGTPVLTRRGSVSIEQVVVGDEVWTHRNRWRRVTATMARESEVVRVGPVVATPDHPFYSRTPRRVWKNGIRRYKRELGDPTWVEARDSHGKFLASPMAVTGEFGGSWPCSPWLAGRFVADGWASDRLVNVAVGQGKAEEFEARSGEEGWTTSESGPNCTRFSLSDEEIAVWLRYCFGHGAAHKTIPTFVLSAPREVRDEFLRGYLSGDGTVRENGWDANTVSPHLASQLRLLALSLGYTANLHLNRTPDTTVIEGRTVNQRDYWTVSIREDDGRYTEVHDGLRWFKQRRKVVPEGTAQVYDLTVEEDHSFLAWGHVVHNCQDFSVAGLRAGMAGERSGLFAQFIRIVEATEPRYAIWENVPGALTSNKGEDFANVLSALVGGTSPLHLPRHPAGRLSRYAGVAAGPKAKVAWRVLDAQHFGVPQRRQRIFAVRTQDWSCVDILFGSEAREFVLNREATCGDAASGFAWLLDVEVPFDTGMEPEVPVPTRLLDVLEPEVDERYFLSEKACIGILRRATRRGKALPAVLHAALWDRAGRPEEFAPSAPVVDDDPGQRFASGDPVPFDWQASGAGDESFRGKSRSYVVRKGHTSGTLQSNKVEAVATPSSVIGFYPTGGTHGVAAAEQQSLALKVGSSTGIPSPPGVATSGAPVSHAFMTGHGWWNEGGEFAGTLAARDYKDATQVVLTEPSDLAVQAVGNSQGRPTLEPFCPTLKAGGDLALGGHGQAVVFSSDLAVSVALRGREDGPEMELGGEVANVLRPSPGSAYSSGVLTYRKVHRAASPEDAETRASAEVANTLNLHDLSEVRANEVVVTPEVTHTLTGEGFDASEDGTGRGTPLVARGFAIEPESGQGADLRAREIDHSPALTSNWLEKTTDRGVRVLGGYGVRRLTPTECERLQGFPDGHTDIDGAKDSPRYKALGNAVAVPVAAWVLARLVEVDQQPRKIRRRR